MLRNNSGGLRGLAQSLLCVSDTLLRTSIANVHHHRERGNLKLFLGIIRSNRAKANRNTHLNERKFRKLRALKTFVMGPLDDDPERKEQMSPLELRLELLNKGINPYRHVTPQTWKEHQIDYNSCYQVMDPYVPSEGPSPDSPYAIFRKNPLKLLGFPFLLPAEFHEKKQSLEYAILRAEQSNMFAPLQHRWFNYKHGSKRIRKRKGFENFTAKAFVSTADEVYLEAHKALMGRDKVSLQNYITETAFGKMWPDVENGSIIWELIEHLEPSKVVSVRCIDFPVQSGNDIAQVIVRMHTKQKLALFDRFGHLVLGSEHEPRSVLEYVVFENHIASADGSWRLHDKVYPGWVGPKTVPKHTSAVREDLPKYRQPLKLGGGRDLDQIEGNEDEESK